MFDILYKITNKIQYSIFRHHLSYIIQFYKIIYKIIYKIEIKNKIFIFIKICQIHYNQQMMNIDYL
jgi:CRISPR/Cas system-associated endoribonuclease Cas2